jgi:hypothetical protein
MFQKAITERWYCSKMRMAPPWSLPMTVMLGFPEMWSSLRVAAIHGEVDGVVEELDRVLVWRGGSA